MADLIISDWKFVRVSLDGIGPFQKGLETFEFTGVDEEPKAAKSLPIANLFMLLAKNSYGKTTVLETIFGLFDLMNSRPSGRFSQYPAAGKAQLDAQATWTVDGRSQSVLLSLWTGTDVPLVSWSEEDLAQSSPPQTWARLGLNMTTDGVGIAEATDELGELFFNSVQQRLGEGPTELFGLSQFMPTVLYFPADRRVVAPRERYATNLPSYWGYQPAQIFSSDGPEWGSSIDNVLVWLDRLALYSGDSPDEKRLEELLDYLNSVIFRDSPGKMIARPSEESASLVQTEFGTHPLAGLSHGERALLQILGRTLIHMTSNTVILIDEIEIHLHTRWMGRMFEAIKDLVRNYQALSIIFTTHNRELINIYKHNTVEKGLIKGGHLIEHEIQ